MAAINILTHLKVNNDRNKISSISVSKYLGMWSAPVTSVILVPELLFIALRYKNPIQGILSEVLGIMITMFGNYLSKCKRNYTLGIKLPWTLNSVNNWNKTHNIAGDIWILGGICMIISGYIWIQGIQLILIILAIITIIPFLYSYWLYKKGV
ncbi:SdpI family protein [Clostridium sp. YIM B02555]|uniref:SdpI family protein n=1 Tax=Clostridium sp. YIM B02555 TaxID=2911968 RepID=UPI001EEE2368|nr:SdpI family protein [Clostridium sp. YIM B02555]